MFAISSLDEARADLAHPVLAPGADRLRDDRGADAGSTAEQILAASMP
jgi:uncharacterized protein (DUF1810 family)